MLKTNYNKSIVYSLLLFNFILIAWLLPMKTAQANSISITYNASTDLYEVNYSTDQGNRLSISFISDSGVPYGPFTYSGSEFQSGVHYLACNGEYTIQILAWDEVISEQRYTTTQVKESSCISSGGDTDDGEEYCGCIFRSPGWQEYMGEIRAIREAIPPAPNWQQVANIMRDTIVPRMISDLGNLLGTAPPPPSSPSPIELRPIEPPPTPEIPDQPSINDYADDLEQQTPSLPENKELEDSGFDFNDIKNEAPEIEFNDDPSGGFKIDNPIDSLPPVEFEDFPMPEDDAGEWGFEYNDLELEAPVPEAPAYDDPISAPIPDQNSGSAPIPNDDLSVPVPDQGGWDSVDYKPHPDAPDGSG